MTVLHAGGKLVKTPIKFLVAHGECFCVNTLSIHLIVVPEMERFFNKSTSVPKYDVKEIGTTDKTGTTCLFAR